jgi:hypothetical protein
MLPARRNDGRQKVARQASLPAPTGGWFVAQNLATAPPQTAYRLDNFFPALDSVRLRRGSTEHATGMTGSVPTLMVYDNAGTTAMFAANGTSIFDVTGTGAAVEVLTGQTSTDWSYVQFTTSGGTFLYMVNGADTPEIYNGSTWATTPAITVATPENLNFVWAYRNRLYFVEKSSMKAWYLPVDSIGGAAVALPLGGVFTLGGNLLCGATWAANLNAKSDETNVFITTQGEVAVYTGSYPGGTDWSLQGVYRIGKPLGKNCLMRAGGDLVIMTEDGIVPMSKIVQLDRVALTNEAITQPIHPAWWTAVNERSALSGWSITLWPLEQMAIVNLPQADANDRTQFIANARSGAWCRYIGWDAKSFGVLNNKLYYGTSDGRVMRAETGGQDDGDLYTANLVMSFNDFKVGPARKHVTAMRPLYRANYVVSPAFSIVADFSSDIPGAPPVAPTISGAARWDSAIWDVDVWPGSDAVQKGVWHGINGFGSTIAPVIQVTVSNTEDPKFTLQQIDLIYEVGSALG